jgi:hypothetical protein
MGTRISSPGDNYYQGRGSSGITDTDLGKTKTTAEEDKLIKSLMLPRLQVKKRKDKFKHDPRTSANA